MLNFLPPAEYLPLWMRRYRYVLWGITGIATLLISCLSCTCWGQRSTYESMVHEHQNLSELLHRLQAKARVEEFHARIEKQMTKQKAEWGYRLLFYDVITAASEQVQLEEIVFLPEGITIRGQCQGEANLFSFLQELESTEGVELHERHQQGEDGKKILFVVEGVKKTTEASS